MSTRTKDFVVLALFVALVFIGGAVIGILTAPGDWYAGLAKPSFNPPNWIFGPVWSTLYILIAIAGWRIWRVARDSFAMKLWWVQLGLNFAWSPTFFGAQQIAAALIVVLAMLLAIVAFIAAAWGRDRIAALLFVPYAAWVSFASLLNGAILALN